MGDCMLMRITILFFLLGIIQSGRTNNEFTGGREGNNERKSSYRDHSPISSVIRNEKDEITPPHHSSKSSNGYETKPNLPQMIEKKDTEKALEGRRMDEMSNSPSGKIPSKSDGAGSQSYASNFGNRGGGGGGNSAGGGGVPALPSPDTEERVDPEMTALGQQYPDAVESAVKNAVSAERSNPGGGQFPGSSETKNLMGGGEKAVDPDRVFMGGAIPPPDPGFGGPIQNPDPNPTQHSPSDPSGHNTMINPVVSHLVDAINTKSVSTEEALQMMNDFVSGNQDMSKAAKNVEGMLSQIATQRRHDAPGASDNPLPSMGTPLMDSSSMLSSLNPQADDSHFFNPGNGETPDKFDSHFFNPGNSVIPNPSNGITGLGSQATGLPGMDNPGAGVGEKDGQFFNPGVGGGVGGGGRVGGGRGGGRGGGGGGMQHRFLNPSISKLGPANNFNHGSGRQSFLYHNDENNQRMYDHGDNPSMEFSERGGYVAQDMATGSMHRIGQQSGERGEGNFHSSPLYGNRRAEGRQMGEQRNPSQSLINDNPHSNFDNFDNSNLRKPISSSSNQGDSVNSYMNGKDSSGLMSNDHAGLPSTDLMGNLEMPGGMGSSNHIGGMASNNHGDTGTDMGIGRGMHNHNGAIHFFEGDSSESNNMGRNTQSQTFMNNRYDDNSEAELPQGHLIPSDYTGKAIGLPDGEVSSSYSRKFRTPHGEEQPRHNMLALKKTNSKAIGVARKHNVIADMYADTIFPEDINDIDSLQGSLDGKTLTNYYKPREVIAARRSFKPENVQHLIASYPLEASSISDGDVRSSVPRYSIGSTHLNGDEKRSNKSSKLHVSKKAKIDDNLSRVLTSKISRVLTSKSSRHSKQNINRGSIQNVTITTNKKSNSTIAKLSNIVKEHSRGIKKRHIVKKKISATRSS